MGWAISAALRDSVKVSNLLRKSVSLFKYKSLLVNFSSYTCFICSSLYSLQLQFLSTDFLFSSSEFYYKVYLLACFLHFIVTAFCFAWQTFVMRKYETILLFVLQRFLLRIKIFSEKFCENVSLFCIWLFFTWQEFFCQNGYQSFDEKGFCDTNFVSYIWKLFSHEKKTILMSHWMWIFVITLHHCLVSICVKLIQAFVEAKFFLCVRNCFPFVQCQVLYFLETIF